MLEIGQDRLTVENLIMAAKKQTETILCNHPAFMAKIECGADFLERTLVQNGRIYGVTTGFGDSCTETVEREHYRDLQINLTRFHGCALGAYFDEETTRAIMIVRLNTLCQGFSGVSYGLLQKIDFFIQNDILPLIPQEGSVGASGDLTPLSYLAGALIGEREVLYKGTAQSSAVVLKKLNEEKYSFRPKEAIAIMNGTAVMNAVAALALARASYLADLACEITALNALALKSNAYHFYGKLFDVKPFPGQKKAAKKILASLASGEKTENVMPEKIQDNYSIRCAPHVIGVFYDTEDLLRTLIETEMNSANDNPIIDPSTNSVYHGGHFYGGHICFAMDSLKNVVANIADLLDRQLALLVDAKYNRGLPLNLSGAGKSIPHNHGFKAVQIASSAWTAEALKNAMPASVFSRSTECHNQDKVSMGTIAARDCIRIIELTEQVASAALLAAVQAVNLRLRNKELHSVNIQKNAAGIYEGVLSFFLPLEEDRMLEGDLKKTLAAIRNNFFKMGGNS